MRSEGRGSDRPSEARSLLVAVVLTAAVSLLVSVAGYATTERVIRSLDETESMAVFLTDDGIKSDDEKFEREINSATAGLEACRDISLGLALGSLLILAAAGRKMSRPTLALPVATRASRKVRR